MEPSLALLAYLIFHSSFQPLLILILAYKFRLWFLSVPLEWQQRLRGHFLFHVGLYRYGSQQPHPLPLPPVFGLPVLLIGFAYRSELLRRQPAKIIVRQPYAAQGVA